MSKNKKNIELKIYEFLGVKQFKKLIFIFIKILAFFVALFMTKEKRKKFYYRLYNQPSNYVMDKGHGIQDMRDFKMMLLFNASVHIWSLYIMKSNLFNLINGNVTLFESIIILQVALINCYCIMLQRYNHIRINNVIERMKPHEEIKKNILKEELTKEDSLLNEHNYKILNKHDKEKDVTFEELLNNASYVQLKQYRDYLLYFKEVNQIIKDKLEYSNEKIPNISVPLSKDESLKLEFKRKQ